MAKLPVVLGFAMLLLAGCSSPPPAGKLVDANYAITPADGTATITYTAESGGIPPTAGQPRNCSLDAVAGQIPGSPVTPCVPASTVVDVKAALPGPGTASYTAYFSGGSGGEELVGELTADPAGGYAIRKEFPSDLSNQFANLEIRLGGYVVATASAIGGPATPLEITSLDGIAVQGTFAGADLSLTISGLPGNTTYNGRLYSKDEAGAVAVAETFPVQNGAVSFTAKKNIGDYAEFHLHVGDSSLNLYKANLEKA